MNRSKLQALQHRLDALRRKCSTGYSCGASCISLRKECRTSPSSSTGKQRLKRLLALAGGEKVPQRGIAPVRAQEAGELAAGISQQRKGAAEVSPRDAPQRLAFKLAYHGTSMEAAEAIREGGYKESKYGTYGPGVYTTTSKRAAREYALWRSAGGKDRFGTPFPASTKGGAVLVHRVPKRKVSKGDPYTYENRQIVGSGGARRLGEDVTNHQPYLVMGEGLADRSLVKQAGTIRKRLRRDADTLQARIDALR